MRLAFAAAAGSAQQPRQIPFIRAVSCASSELSVSRYFSESIFDLEGPGAVFGLAAAAVGGEALS
jgi:hypothetical protein